MLELRGFSVHLVCEGQNLEEFSVNVDDEKSISCYVPSEAGKTFSIAVKNNLDAMVVARCLVDGERAHMPFVHPQSQEISTGFLVDETTFRSYNFNTLTVTDDEMVDPEDPALCDLGTIEVRIFRVKKGKPIAKPTAPSAPKLSKPVHERCKKAGTHRVSYGEATKVEKPRCYYETIWIDPHNQPYATFRLRYRPRELLRAQGIIMDGADINDERSSSGSHPSADTAETYESDSDVVVLDGPPSKKRRINSSTSVDVKPTIDVDALDADGTDDTGDDLDVATIAEQIRSLTKQLERKLRKKKRTVTGARGKKAKKEKLEEIDVHLG